MSTANGAHAEIVSEIIGRTTSPFPRHLMAHRVTVDRTTVDYQWWSNFRRGKESGFELGGAFARPILNIMASWVLGSGFEADADNDPVNERLAEFVSEELDTLLTWYTDGLALGDSYLIVNADGSLTMAPPDTVEILTDPLDYRTVLGYRITTKLETVTITDEYRANVRVVTFQEANARTKPTPITFDNPLGMIPVIPFHNEREANETNGHPVYEGLLHLFVRYDDLLNKSLDGAEVMGRPVPVATSDSPERDRQINATRTEQYTDKDGNSQNEYVVDFAELSMLWLKAGGDFKFASPGPFAADSKTLLKTLFYLMLEHIGVPEWAWGGAIASSMASVEAQMPAFVRLIERFRKALAGPLKQLLLVWVRSVSLFEFLPAIEAVMIEWPEVVEQDEALMVEKILGKTHGGALGNGLIKGETALRILDIVEDPAAEYAEGQQEMADKEEQQMKQTIQTLEAEAEVAANNPTNQPQPEAA